MKILTNKKLKKILKEIEDIKLILLKYKLTKEKAIGTLCSKLDEILYLPFREHFENTGFGIKKETFKRLIENVINKMVI